MTELIDATSTSAGSVEPRVVALERIHRLLRLSVVATAVVVALWLLGGVLMIIFAAALLGVILHGLAQLLTHWTRCPHWLSLTIVVVVLAALFIGLGVSAGPGLSDQASALRKALGTQGQALHARLSASEFGRLILDQVPTFLGGSKEDSTPSLPTGVAGSVFGLLGAAFGVFGTLAVVFIAAIYFAASPSIYVDGFLRLVAVKHRPRARALSRAAGHALWAWSAGQAVDMLVVGILSALGLWIIGVPLAVVLGVVAALSNFVPYIGAIAGAVPAVIIAFSVGVPQGLETIALYLVIQAFEGNVMAPLIQRRAVHMPPALTILAQTLFGAIFGIAGLIFATPLTAALLAVGDKAAPPLRDADRI